MQDFFAAGMHWRFINFILFVGGLFYFLRAPVKKFWMTRSRTIQSHIEEALRLEREAQEKMRGIEERLAHIHQEADALIRSLDERGELEKKQMIQEAENLSKRFKQDADLIADHEIRKARETLKTQAARLSIELAERLIREKIIDADQERLSKEYVAYLEKGLS